MGGLDQENTGWRITAKRFFVSAKKSMTAITLDFMTPSSALMTTLQLLRMWLNKHKCQLPLTADIFAVETSNTEANTIMRTVPSQ